jgi:16S rRNA processing protein RimM
MSCADYELVARVGKTHGLEGEVTATAAGDLPFSVYEGLHVFVVPPTIYGQRELVVSSINEATVDKYYLRFEDVDSIEDAEQIAGHFLLADAQDIEEYFDDDYMIEIGRSVIDEEHGELGKIVEVIETPANDVWVVHGAYGEVLIPVVDEVIVSLPEEPGIPIRTCIMDGLLEK